MRRWLVALALAVVVMPEVDAAAAELRVDLATRKVTATSNVPLHTCLPRPGGLPAGVEIDHERVRIRAGGKWFDHAIGDLWWSVAIGDHLVIGHAARPGGHADRIVAIDRTTGRLAWKRKVDSLFAAELVDDLLALERAGTLDVLDARTGKTLGTTVLSGQGIQAICRGAGGLHVKTGGDLVAIDRATGQVRWTQPTTSRGNLAMTSRAVVDAWVDRARHRYGIVTYDPTTGRRLESIELGPTGGWYDVERVELAPDGAGEVLVSSMFGVE
jgi:hypothetical protein